jgi:hypothetical protein
VEVEVDVDVDVGNGGGDAKLYAILRERRRVQGFFLWLSDDWLTSLTGPAYCRLLRSSSLFRRTELWSL